ncbi:MAG: hypothetical protein A3F80_01910 [Candidatus Melainabacteria bacterium RIFCSPLOWO2_12_FULL_35_11]|nr:MAG: hypothetical protein A3F80_01910 [Candidatus Melainabacteria bacterium RIFCSPLOWO2_12_FULL_35_11]
MSTLEIVENFKKGFNNTGKITSGLVHEKPAYDIDKKKRLLVEKRKLIREQLQSLIKRSYPSINDSDLKKCIPSRKLTVEGIRIGETIDDKYRVEKLLDSGSMGNVYAVRDIENETVCAMKTLVEAVHSEKAVRRFIREAKELSRLDHQYIINVIDFGMSEGRPYYIMENLSSTFNSESSNMEALIKTFHEQKISLKEMLKYFAQIAEALDYLHTRERAITHRDLKPSNVLVSNKSIKLIDFGVAGISSGTLTALTDVNEVLGTAHYFAVTDWDKHDLGPESDIYSLGVMLYYLVTKKLPFDIDNKSKINTEQTIDFIPAPEPGAETIDYISAPAKSDIYLADTQISKNTPGSGYKNKGDKDSMLKLFKRAREMEPVFKDILPGIEDRLIELIKRLLSKNSYDRPNAKSVAQELYRIEGSIQDPTPVYLILKSSISS